VKLLARIVAFAICVLLFPVSLLVLSDWFNGPNYDETTSWPWLLLEAGLLCFLWLIPYGIFRVAAGDVASRRTGIYR
jgi:hypothetical protein